jgi:hypothetical protein
VQCAFRKGMDCGCLTPEFFAVELPEMKVYLGGMSILSILLSLGPEYHTRCPSMLMGMSTT